MLTTSEAAQEIIRKFKEAGYVQVPGYNRFGFIRESGRSVIISREAGQDTKIPISKLEKAIDAVRIDPGLYNSGPSALRKHDLTHITSPLWALLHLLTLDELTK